jgi:hypothetical protein|mmetsp:Transcript_81869/g.132803  ORF Transcript_81869/g.132803 Transcript_81869/m.132803 type:complete len:312 (+) Transcript_81869:3042-3977(+)
MFKFKCIYLKNLGRLILEDTEFFRCKGKVSFFISYKEKKVDKLELKILTLNSTNQNDLLSSLNLVFDFKKLILNSIKHIYFKTVNKSTILFKVFIQKVISGNSLQTNTYLLKNILIRYSPQNILIDSIQLIKIFRWYKFLKKPDNSLSGILSNFKSSFKELVEIRFIDFILNKNYCDSILDVGLTNSINLKLIPFILNSSFFMSRFFFFKLCFFYQLTEEHFSFKICDILIKNEQKVSACYIIEKSRNFFLRFFDLFDLLLILQSIEGLILNYQVLSLNILIFCRHFLNNYSNSHPIVRWILKKIRSNFYF